MAANTVTITGKVTGEPRVYDGKWGKLVTLNIVNSRKMPNKDEYRNTYVDVVVSGDDAEKVSGLVEGDRILVEGMLDMNSWTDDSGKKHSKLQIKSRNIALTSEAEVDNDGDF